MSDPAGLGQALLARVARPLGVLDRDEVRGAMLATARDAFVALDAEGRVIAWEGGAESLLGWPRDEVVGLDFGDVCVPPGLRDRHAAGLRRVVQGGEARMSRRRLAVPVVARGGEMRTVELTLGVAEVRGRRIVVASMRQI